MGDDKYRRIPLSAERLEPIEDMAHSIAAAGNVQDVFRALFAFSVQTTPADGIFVALYSPTSELRRCVYAAGAMKAAADAWEIEEDEDLSIYPELPLNDGPQSRAIVTGQIVNTPNIQVALEGLTRVDSGSDYAERPPRSGLAVPFATDERVLGAFELQSTEPDAFRDEHVPMLRMAARLAAIALANLDLRSREQAQHEAVLRSLGLALEYRDYETKGHTDRVVALSVAFAEVTACPAEDIEGLRWGAYLHDLGKVAIPDQILLKPGRLTEDEFRTIQRHTLIGVDMCRDIPFLPKVTRQVVRSHHERWDGSGYPDGLVGEATPVFARMFSLVDVYDALTSERPYKSAWSHDEALAEIHAQSGRQFDPNLVVPFEEALQAWRAGTGAPKLGSGTLGIH